ncbi:MAG: MMPL family transporter [Lutisporaceae bacterium]
MRRFSSFIVNHKRFILIVYAILIVLSFIGMRFVSIEYDLSSYLPKDMNSIMGKEILEKDFEINGAAKLVIKSNDLSHVQSIKQEIKNIEGVKNVIWLDDVEDIMKQEAFFDQKLSEHFRVEDYNLMQIEFYEGNDDKSTQKAIGVIDSMIPEEHYIGGPAAISKSMQDTISKEMLAYSLVAFIIILIILFMSSSSYFEPILFFIALGVAILLNMGTNFIFGRISSNTYSVASILQLAVSMDYSIFLLHRFHEELQVRDKKEAMIVAIERTFSAVSASALTTVCGFLALVAMKYGIGKDMGLVLAKGVLLSLITVITLLPVLALATEDKFKNYKHKILLPSFEKSAKYMVKGRHLVLALSLLIIIPAFLGQSKLSYYYSTEKTLSKTSEAVLANKKINEVFGENSELVLIVPKADRVKLDSMTQELKQLKEISTVQGLYTSVDTALPEILIPQMVRDRFESDKYTYFVLNLRYGVEAEQTKTALRSVDSIASSYFNEHYLTGEASVYRDLNTVTSTDFSKINMLSILFIGLILLVTFKSIVLPLILILVIQLGIWINLSIPYFQGGELNFISFIIIGAIQLGATVDYAILFTTRYKENLGMLKPIEAITQTIKDTGRSVLTSALILFAGTLSVSYITTIRSASELTLLIGRGAIISLVLVFLLLPALLLLLNKPIKYTTLGWPTTKK